MDIPAALLLQIRILELFKNQDLKPSAPGPGRKHEGAYGPDSSFGRGAPAIGRRSLCIITDFEGVVCEAPRPLDPASSRFPPFELATLKTVINKLNH